MEKASNELCIRGSRQSNLKKVFKLAARSLLTACSKQDFLEVFSEFSVVEQEQLYRLYIQVITSLHHSVEDEFETLFHETQVGPVLDTVEYLVEEQSLDPLFSDKTNVMDIASDLSTSKKKEIQFLTSLLQRAEEQNLEMESRISLLRQQAQELSTTSNAIKKLKTGISNYFESSNDKLLPI